MSAAVSPLFFERYELKYLVTLSHVEAISRYLESFCELDYYSEVSHDQFYEINSLYMDSPGFRLFRSKLQGINDRFNLRIRSYGANPKPPYFFEVKSKHNGFVKKYRSKVYTENWAELLDGNHTDKMTEETLEQSEKNLLRFLHLANTIQAEPKVLTRYRRKAYISILDDYGRVTFDKELQYQLDPGYSVHPANSLMTNYDHEARFPDGRNVILELKCPAQVPLWMLDLIRRFQLERCGFSKYSSSIEELMEFRSQQRLTRQPVMWT